METKLALANQKSGYYLNQFYNSFVKNLYNPFDPEPEKRKQ